jgi:hypothetical protein
MWPRKNAAGCRRDTGPTKSGFNYGGARDLGKQGNTDEASKANDVYAFSILATEVSNPNLSETPQSSSGFLCTRGTYYTIFVDLA